MTCSNCGHESNGKFCGKCGTPLNQQPDPGVLKIQEKCPSCSGWITPGKKFCGGCGAKLSPAESDAASAKLIDPVSVGIGVAAGAVAGAAVTAVINAVSPNKPAEVPKKETGVEVLDKCCIKLDLMPDMIARRVSEKEMEAYSKREGVIVSPGTLLIVIADGRIVSKLSGGRYSLPMDQGKHISHLVKESSSNFIDKVINWFRSKDNVTEEPAISHQEAETIRKAKHISLVLVREGDFDLNFDFQGNEKLPFAGGVTSEVGITLLLKVNDAEALFKQAMVDKVIKATLADILKPRLRMELSRILPSYQMESFVPGPEVLDGLPPVLREAMDSVYPGVTVLRVITATTKGEQLNSIREAANEMYTAKLKLAQNEELFAVRNIARSQENRKILDDAKNETEMAEALRTIAHQAYQSELVSKETMDVFTQEMLERYKDRSVDSLTKDLKRSQVIDLMDIDLTLEKEKSLLRSQMLLGLDKHSLKIQDLDQQLEFRKKDLEGQVGIRKSQIEIDRVGHSYSDERRDKELEFEAKKRTQEIQIQSESRGERLKRLAELDAIRNQRKDSDHQREVELERLRNEAELAKKRLEDEGKVKELSAAAGMSFEQIMAMKQELSGDAGARALEARYAAEAKKTEALAGADHAREMAERERELADRERRINEERMADERARMDSMMDRMQQMAEGAMKSTTNIATGQNAANQKALEQADERANKRGAEIVKSVEKTLQSSASVFAADARAKGPLTGKIAWYCKCGAGNPKEADFCLECGDNKGKTPDSGQKPEEGGEGSSSE